MTKRDRLSFALRRLRTTKTQEDAALRIQKTHEIVKEIIDELSKGTKNADLGQHTIEVLEGLYALNTGAIEDGRLPAPPLMPDCTEQIHEQTEALQAIDADDDQTWRSETATVLRHMLSLFALGPNEAPIHAFLDALDKQVAQANARPMPVPDYVEQLLPHANALSQLADLDDPDLVRESAVNSLCRALSIFAQGPNEQPVQTLLNKVREMMERAKTLKPALPDYADRLKPHIDALEALVYQNEPGRLGDVETNALRHILSTFADGPNEKPIQRVVAALEQLNEQKESGVMCSDDADQLQSHIAALRALDGLDDPDALTAAAAMALYEALADLAKGPHEASIRALLDAFDKVI
jgi:hypothetical protein